MAIRRALLRVLTQRSKHNYFAFVPSREEHEEHYRQYNNGYRKNRYKIGATTTLLGAVVLGAKVNDRIENNITLKTKDVANKAPSKDNNGDDDDTFEAGGKIPGLPSYSAEEVSKHDSTESFWVTYKNGVYDVTEFLVSHPGGEQILHAAGLSIEPFWNVYGMHKTPEIYRLLESFRIGNLNDEDVVDHSEDELWVKEPFRDKRLIVKTEKPFNAEIPAKYQIAHFDTPNELFYVRQHMPVPELNASTHTLEITVVGDKRTTHHKFTLEELMSKFRPASVRAALMCAGNRRSEMDKQVKPVKGINWAGGAISNAVWSGVYLREVLLHCGVDLENTEGKHVVFRGSDIDATGVQFSTSVPLGLAGGAAARVLLATHMNGAPLPPDHGAPLRVVVPGAPAVRSVKWLESITISEEESPSHWHQKDYRSFNSTKTWETADFSTAPPIYSLPVTSAICDPSDSDTVRVKNGCIEVKGYAYSGGGAKILRVDVSPDGGRSWVEAELQADPAPPHYHYSWTLFTAQVPVERGQTEVELWAKATDSNFNTQPETFEHIWNIRGILSNAYHRIKVRLQH